MKLFDCFIFNGELDMLEIRLNIMYDYVDMFVIVEGEETFTGNPKPLFLLDNQSRFDKFADKIKYLTVPALKSIPCPWGKEAFHRNSSYEGLEKARPSDFILLSDLDEVPDPEKFYYYLTRLNEPFTLEMVDHCYYLNCSFVYEPEWIGTIVARKSIVDECFKLWDKSYYGYSDVGFQKLRKTRKKFLRVPLSGWHYQNVMSEVEISRKLSSFAHVEANVEEINNIANILNHKKELEPINPSGKQSKVSKYEITSYNTSKHVLENQENFIKSGLLKE